MEVTWINIWIFFKIFYRYKIIHLQFVGYICNNDNVKKLQTCFSFWWIHSKMAHTASEVQSTFQDLHQPLICCTVWHLHCKHNTIIFVFHIFTGTGRNTATYISSPGTLFHPVSHGNHLNFILKKLIVSYFILHYTSLKLAHKCKF